ncbi:MAG: hemerythrin domain-containing protein [Anaerolineales bacterium]|nr:hemerythrin domain-containing protein [Anaerolineales bacterium]
MLITDALLGEHGVFHFMLARIEQSLSALDALPAADSLSALQQRIVLFASTLESHASIEDELLFNALEPHLGIQGGPLAVMRIEHDQITDLLGKIESASDLASARALTAQMIQVTRGHFQKEEQALFRMARQCLSDDELAALGVKWAQKRAPLIQLDGM